MSESIELQIHALERRCAAERALIEWSDSGGIPTEVIDEVIAAALACARPGDGELLEMVRGLKS